MAFEVIHAKKKKKVESVFLACQILMYFFDINLTLFGILIIRQLLLGGSN